VSDRELARAVVRAANDWHLEEWAGTYPGRIVPLQLPWLLDPEEGAAEIRANAGRGFHAVTFPELPEKLGLPSLHTGYWDPFVAACAETGTVICLHVGSSSSAPATSSGAPSDTVGVLFFGWAMFAAVDWLYSKLPVRYPELKICLSEGGIGWVAGLLDRLDHVTRFQRIFGTWNDVDLTPREVMQRNFWFCTIDDLAGLEQRHHIGVDHLLLESDYPHQDGTWPDTQAIVWSQIGHFPADEIARMTWRNASELFQHPVPIAAQTDPDSF
jgi:predicted TIM-barrel fold metal-dependent hydrolase